MILLKNVLVATDFSPPSDAALTYGRALARTFGASLHVLHVVENYFMRPTTAAPYIVQEAKTRMLDGGSIDRRGSAAARRTHDARNLGRARRRDCRLCESARRSI